MERIKRKLKFTRVLKDKLNRNSSIFATYFITILITKFIIHEQIWFIAHIW